MALRVPQHRLDLLRQAYPEHYLEHEPFVSLGTAHQYLNLPQTLQSDVNDYGIRERKRRRHETALAVGGAGSVVALAVSFAWGMVPVVVGLPIIAARRSAHYLCSDAFGDTFVAEGRRRLTTGLVPIVESLAVGSGIGWAASLIPTVYMGIPGLATTLGSYAWYLNAAQHRIGPVGQGEPLFVPTHYDASAIPVERLRGSEVVAANKLLPDALRDVLSTDDTGASAPPLVSVHPWDYFGGLPIRRGSASNNNTLFVGMPGSGKTSFLRVLMGTLLPAIKGFKPVGVPQQSRYESRKETIQAIVYDAKTENIPILVGHGFVPRKTLFVLNAFDKRSVVWDMAKDIKGPAEAALLADMLLSHRKSDGESGNQFFVENARNQIQAVIETFIQRGGQEPKWRFADIINAFTSMDVLRHVLTHHTTGEVVIGQTLDVHFETASNIFTSTATSLSRFRILASLWAKKMAEPLEPGTVNAISLDEWLRSRHRSVLLLPNTRENATIIRPLNELLFNRLGEMLLDKRWNQHEDTPGGKKTPRAIFLDECPHLGKLDKLTDLMAQGRSFGVQVILGVQAYSQMASAYGQEDAKTILGMCAYRGYLRCDGDTAEWASKQIGQQLQRFSTSTYTTGQSGSRTSQSGWGNTTNKSSGQGGNRSYNESRSETDGWSSSSAEAQQERVIETVMASELTSLADPKREGHIEGYFVAPGFPVFKSTTAFTDIDKMTEPYADVPEREQGDNAEEWLPAWTRADYERLGLAPLADAKEEASESPKRDRPTEYPDLFS